MHHLSHSCHCHTPVTVTLCHCHTLSLPHSCQSHSTTVTLLSLSHSCHCHILPLSHSYHCHTPVSITYQWMFPQRTLPEAPQWLERQCWWTSWAEMVLFEGKWCSLTDPHGVSGPNRIEHSEEEHTKLAQGPLCHMCCHTGWDTCNVHTCWAILQIHIDNWCSGAIMEVLSIHYICVWA